MSRLTLYNDSTNDATVVSNRFIDEFMKDANDAQLKVYFYLIRMLNANLATSITDIADKFNHTETDVIRSLKYWERMKLLHLEYDEQDNITGIHIQDLDKMPTAEIVPLAPRKSTPAPAPKQAKSAPKQAQASAASVPPTAKVEEARHTYSLDEVKAYKKDDDFARILFVSEQYLQRPLTPSDIQTFLYLYDGLHLSADLMDYLVEYCVSRHKTSRFYIESVALDWANANITTIEQAKSHASRYEKAVYTILKALGNSNMPTEDEAKMIQKWINTYAFSQDIILEACRRCVLATNNNRLSYADSILTNWYNNQVHHLSDIEVLDNTHAKKTTAKAESKTSGKPNTFNQFEQRSYDFDALEKELLSN